MNKSLLKPGVVLKCKSNMFIGSIHREDSTQCSGPSYVIISPKKLFSNFGFEKSDHQVLLYIGTIPSRQLELFDHDEKASEVHEVLWKGTVFLIRSASFKHLSMIR